MTGSFDSGLAAESLPFLATPEQIDAEKTLLHLLKDPEVRRIQAKLKTDLAATPRGRMEDAAARLDEVIAQWTNSLIFGEIIRYRSRPAALWGTDDTPRSWLGHTLGGLGMSGDNPDAVYRMATIDGGGRYEILGRFDPSTRAVQFVAEADRGDVTLPPKLDNSKHSDIGTLASMITDRDLVVASDGTFRITVGGSADGPNHLATEPGVYCLGFRDILSDWNNQRACRLIIRRLDSAVAKPADLAELRRHVHEDLEAFVRFWARFPDIWFFGLKPNTISDTAAREGGFGFNAGCRFQLAPGTAVLVTTWHGDAAYTGFQLTDPWMIAPDARKHQCSLNSFQSVPNADGSFTYVIAASDPGVANWLDTAGFHDGFGVLRWQGVPRGASKEGLIREFRVIEISDLANMSNLARITPEKRQAQLASRADGYIGRGR
ncbi:MAG: hypothetical protein EPO08_13165 [Rhodospirillaceae bacterium]|nr:MAG: hypothetical protein EPO08_13165 [Rhodospirillaceae bacterium]